MAYTNSSLVSYTQISPNRTKNRTHAIDTITIHCVVGQCSVETLGSIFAAESRQASSNYGIGKDGRIGMYCEEKDRSWCSSNAANDHRAITIEVASDTTDPYAVNDTAYAALIDLVTDICQRNGIAKLVWSTSKNDRVNHLNGCNMTVHRDYANKSCPGDYLYERHGEIAAAVNQRLGAAASSTSTDTTYPEKLTSGYYRVRKTWSDGKTQLGAYRILANAKKKADENAGYSVFDNDGNVVYSGAAETAEEFTPYKVQVKIATLNIRTGPGTNYDKTGQYTGKGVFTIVAESSGTGSNTGWGKLKSGAGWISLDYATKI
ncbi:MAG: amidase [Lachnospiraceae bacterium]|nr:amidase [Lachnospiraceae bacterium]